MTRQTFTCRSCRVVLGRLKSDRRAVELTDRARIREVHGDTGITVIVCVCGEARQFRGSVYQPDRVPVLK